MISTRAVRKVTIAASAPVQAGRTFFPQQHGATAMLLAPFFCAAAVLKRVYWVEGVILIAIVCAFAIKDPLLVLARQLWIWKQEHPETKAARRWVGVESILLSLCGLALLGTRNWRSFMLLSLGAVTFTVVAVMVNLRNRQRSEWFQVASAVALTSTSLAAGLSAQGAIPGWCWVLWLLCALQAAAGIFVVHARLDARIAVRKGARETSSRRAALVCQVVLLAVGGFFAYNRRPWITAALLMAAAGYLFELRRQKKTASLQMPLTRVGIQALTLLVVYSVLIVIGLW